MEDQYISAQDVIDKSLHLTEKAIEMLRDGDICRRRTALELRDMQLHCHEDFIQLRQMFDELDERVQKEIHANSKWIDKRIGEAKAKADQALASTLMVKDIQMLEKKVNILKESVIQLNKAYYKYAKDVDMNDLIQQVKDMVTRIQIIEKMALNGNTMGEQEMEIAFRGAMETLYSLQSNNPKVMEEAKQLADDMRVFRDAAANKNFYKMISKSKKSAETASSYSSSAFETASESTTNSSSTSSGSASNSSIQTATSSVLFP
ncbi:hypothetical protein CAEBREN_30993 [Caenorhabditis brenneri]|uniref:Uncharacterized protein n=1 Tax=Caenorhabditis brenneri TaxID=135651 RepID=G0N2K1_CAEBE|nr:hypothetical protein CAEBREN_30993 [Caenorhabditis brenneri]